METKKIREIKVLYTIHTLVAASEAASETLTILWVRIIGVLCLVFVQITWSFSYWYRSLMVSHALEGKKYICIFNNTMFKQKGENM